MGKEQVVGTWRVVSLEAQADNGQVFHMFGKNPIGMVTYDAAGYMSAQIMNPNRPRLALGDDNPADEVKAVFNGMICYFGTYEVDEEDRSVSHYVEGCCPPNLEGKVLKRYYTFSGNRLTLSAPGTPFGELTVNIDVVWERLP